MNHMTKLVLIALVLALLFVAVTPATVEAKTAARRRALSARRCNHLQLWRGGWNAR